MDPRGADGAGHWGRIFQRDILQGIGSSGVALAVTLFTTPMMTRLFPAEAYGAYGLINTTATVVSGFGLLGLPVALARAQAGAEQARLLTASIQVAAILCALLVAGAVFVYLGSPDGVAGVSVGVILLLPLLVLCHAGQRISDSLAGAQGLFPELAAARIVGAISTRGLTLAAGWMVQASAGAMVVGDAVGKALHIAVTAMRGSLGATWRTLPRSIEKESLYAILRDYSDFALYSNLATILPLVMVLGLQALVGERYGVGATGQFVLAQSILSLPVTLLAMASAPVIFYRLVRAADEAPENLLGLVLRAMFAFLVLGAISMLPIALFGPSLFAFVFGEPWRQSGVLAAALSLPQVMSFSLTALLSLFRVTRRLRFWLGLEVLGSVLVVGGFAMFSYEQDFTSAIGDMAWLLLIYQVLMHMGFLFVVCRHRGTRDE